jgi:D-tyrosyl-tRNA(Tyr) deacylase
VRAVVQRVSSASVTVGSATVGRIDEPGLVVLLGVSRDDDTSSADAMAAKLYGLRILDDEASVADTGAPVLVISQFTLYGDTRKGRRPTWAAAAPAEQAEPLVTRVVNQLRDRGVRVESGQFGAQMSVSLVNEGPFTVLVETGAR